MRWKAATVGVVVAAAAGAAGGLVACSRSAPDVDTSRPRDEGIRFTSVETLVKEGETAYVRHCVGCHGAAGDGKGEAATFLFPKPRNFTLAHFKFSSTRSGRLPTDADLKRSIRNGLKGSAMPGFSALSERTLDGLVAYIKTFSPKWASQDTAPPIPIHEDPYRSNPDKTEAIRRGEVVYHGYVTCWSCHPAYVSTEKINEYLVACGSESRSGFRPNLDGVEVKPNVEGELVYPTDFRRDFVRSGSQIDDLYRVISAGLTGTAMPTWVDAMHVAAKEPGGPPLVQPSDLWAMAYYVQDLIAQRPPKLKEGAYALRSRPQWISLTGEPAPAPPTEKQDAEAVEFIEDE